MHTPDVQRVIAGRKNNGESDKKKPDIDILIRFCLDVYWHIIHFIMQFKNIQ
jgi:hypothetical protein